MIPKFDRHDVTFKKDRVKGRPLPLITARWGLWYCPIYAMEYSADSKEIREELINRIEQQYNERGYNNDSQATR